MNDGNPNKLYIKIEEISSSRSITNPLLRISFGGLYYKDSSLTRIPSISSQPHFKLSSDIFPHVELTTSSSSLFDPYYPSLEYVPSPLPFSYAWNNMAKKEPRNAFSLSFSSLHPSIILSNVSSFLFEAQNSIDRSSFFGRCFSFPLSDHVLLFNSISINLYEQYFISGYRLIGSLTLTPQQNITPARWIDFEPHSGTTSSASILLAISTTDGDVENGSIRDTHFLSPGRTIFSAKLPMWLKPLLSFLDEETINLGVCTLLNLFSSFGQGLEGYSHSSLLGALVILSRFESWKRSSGLYSLDSIHYKKTCINDQKFIEKARHSFRFAMSAYGWKGLTLLGRRTFNNFLSNPSSERIAILSYLDIKECDLLHITESNGLFQPHCVIFYDGRSSDVPTIVLALRGSLSATDWMTSFGGEYTPWKGGFVHSGVAKAAFYVKKKILPLAVSYARQFSVSRISIVGHSLGGATALLTRLFVYFEDNSDDDEHNGNGDDETIDLNGVSIEAFAFGSPPIISLDLLPLFEGLSTYSFIFGNDIVPHISYGSLMDYRALIERATAHVSIRNILNPVI